MTTLASVDYGSVPAWISALTPLLIAGVITRALNRTTASIREAVRSTRPRTLRQRLRGLTQPPPRTEHHSDGHHSGHGSAHHGDYVDGSE
ncbi:hypothetical protein [Streptomyces violaceusniger]|uniref:Uncharacterized protein n=1 Tax=Streptomyces violaceusniger (strain Tu 4113) TaxID=653045 RepID=G2PHI3_STRV4|nr:hypothetical protein [Streptomyces violaceusniger]AEM88986.1 hypothetical protein Strvi_0213 [Streptomyces violaceusniger Tu 4113]